MRFRVAINRREGLRDPEGVATLQAVRDLGFRDVAEVHFGRIITIDVAAGDRESAQAEVVEMCERLLANPVIEDYTVEFIE
jgi:phosphoribosylformylglycinamidine synthase